MQGERKAKAEREVSNLCSLLKWTGDVLTILEQARTLTRQQLKLLRNCTEGVTHREALSALRRAKYCGGREIIWAEHAMRIYLLYEGNLEVKSLVIMLLLELFSDVEVQENCVEQMTLGAGSRAIILY